MIRVLLLIFIVGLVHGRPQGELPGICFQNSLKNRSISIGHVIFFFTSFLHLYVAYPSNIRLPVGSEAYYLTVINVVNLWLPFYIMNFSNGCKGSLRVPRGSPIFFRIFTFSTPRGYTDPYLGKSG